MTHEQVLSFAKDLVCEGKLDDARKAQLNGLSFTFNLEDAKMMTRSGVCSAKRLRIIPNFDFHSRHKSLHYLSAGLETAKAFTSAGLFRILLSQLLYFGRHVAENIWSDAL